MFGKYVFAWAALLPQLLLAQTLYEYRDEHGRVTYTDRPGLNHTPLETENLPGYSAWDTQALPPPPRQQAATSDFLIEFVSPESDAYFTHEVQQIMVSVRVNPAIPPDYETTLSLDGEVISPPASRFTEFVVENVTRGTHRLEFAIYDASGQLVKTSGPWIFYQNRQSVL